MPKQLQKLIGGKMKKVISIFILLSTLCYALTQTEILDQLQTGSNKSETKFVDVQTQMVLAKEESKAIKENIKTENVKTEDYENENIQNKIEVTSVRTESIYSKYLSEVIKKDSTSLIFGLDIVNNSTEKQIPDIMSKDYVLASGDVIIAKIWSDIYAGGTAETNQILPLEINKSGSVFVPNVGSFFVSGKSINNFEKELITEARKKMKYFNAEISLGKIREISVFVTGEVNMPGYVVTTAYSNLLTVLNNAKGISKKASLRNIKIIRDGQELTIDLYGYLLGNQNIDEIKLKDGDTVFVPTAEKLVLIEGAIKRPAYYEVGKEKDYKELINIAGGFTQLASKEKIEVYSVSGDAIKLETADNSEKINLNIFKINVNKIDENNRNEVFILGAVINPDVYAFEKGMNFNNLLKKSGGYIKESSQVFVTIIRGREKRKVINFNPINEDVKLEIGDEIYVYNYNDINNKNYASINGAVIQQGSYEIYEGSKIINLLYSARGLQESENPYMNRADLYRIGEEGKLKVYKVNLNKLLAGDENENILLKNNDVLKIYKYDEVVKYDELYIYGEVREPGKYRYYENMTLEDMVFYAKGMKNKADNNITVVRNENNKFNEFVIDLERNPDFKILEGDLIFVRKKADWIETKIVTLQGFVKYPGSYQLNTGETLSSLVKRAGGFIKEAFPEGVQFSRGNNKQRITNFEFEPNSQSFIRDIELVDGDTIFVPEKQTTVKVEGEVYTPSLIVYDKKMGNYKDYIAAAGGYKETAYKKRVFVIKANGKTVDNPSKTKIEPGDTIYIPLDAREKKGIDRGMELFKGTLEIVSTIALIIVLF